MNWYAVKVAPRCERKVKVAIENIAERKGLTDQIPSVVIPEYKGYVLVEMEKNVSTEMLVRNIYGVSYILGSI